MKVFFIEIGNSIDEIDSISEFHICVYYFYYDKPLFLGKWVNNK